NGKTNTDPSLDRRAFLRVVAGPAGAFVFAFALPVSAEAPAPSGSAAAPPGRDALTASVSSNPARSVVLFAENPDCGQGITTTFGMSLAEELDADWNRVRVEQAPVAEIYGPQSSGGSNSTPTNWDRLRKAAASARTMLVAAAAQRWQVPTTQLVTRTSQVWH